METALNNCTIMFDLLKLFQKKQELQLALVGATESLSDAYRMNFGCEDGCSAGCANNCSGTCDNTCDTDCTGYTTSH